MLTKHYETPSIDGNIFNGILRNTRKLNLKETGHWEHLDVHYILGTNYSLFWHSKGDNYSKQYIEISFSDRIAEVFSYHFNNGNNGDFYTVTWTINCSMDGKDWTAIDKHSNDLNFVSSNQSRILNMQKVERCMHYRIFFPGRDSYNREYNYLGLFEFYGKVYIQLHSIKRCTNNNYFSFIASLILLHLS